MDTAATAKQMPSSPPPTNLNRRHAPRRKPGKVVLKTLSQLDLRTGAARRVRQLISIWENELGGADVMTESLRQLIHRAALLSVLIESSEAEWLSGGALAESTYFTAINSLRRILESIGIDRRAVRDITPTLEDITREVVAARVAKEPVE